jgi:hypothetical protein
MRHLLPLLAPLLLVACERPAPDVAHCEPPARLVLAIAAITWPDSMYLVRWPDTLMVGQGVHLTPFCVASGIPITWIDARGHPIRPQPVGTAITVVPNTESDTSRH